MHLLGDFFILKHATVDSHSLSVNRCTCFCRPIIRPPDILVARRRLPRSSLNGTQPKPATCSKVSAIWKFWNGGIPSHYKTGASKPLFSTSQLKGNFNFGSKHNIENRASALAKGFSTSSQNDRDFGPQTA